LFDDDFMNAMEFECVTAQRGVVSGELSERHGNTMLVDDADGSKTIRVCELRPACGIRPLVPLPTRRRAVTFAAGITAARARAWLATTSS
jgi:hypothetical protein